MSEPDLDRVAAIERAVFPEPWTRDCFRLDMTLPGVLCLVAEEAGDVAGYLIAWRDQGAHVANIAVAPGFRRRGIGAALMEAADEYGRSHGECRLWLEVRERNLDAQQFYLELGFGETGRRPGYYTNGEDALLFSRTIAPAR